MGSAIPVVVALGAVFLAYTFLASPLNKIPGPFWARFSRLWLIYHYRKGDMHTTMVDLHKKHGRLVRTSPNEVSLSDPAVLKTIYGAGSKFKKSDFFAVQQGHRTFDLFGERDEKKHSQQKRLVSHIYSLDQLKKLEPYVDTTVSFFIQKLRDLSQGSQSVDMAKWAQMFAFDVIGEVTFSRPFGFLETGKDDGSFAAIDVALEGSWIGYTPWLYWVHDFFMPVFGNLLGVNNRNGAIRLKTFNEIKSREGRGSDHRDILAALKDVQDAKPGEFGDDGVLGMAASNVFAGSDTTGISISAIIYNLCKYPRTKEKLLDEIKTTIQKEGIDPKGNMPFKAGFAMPYLQAVIYEALRLHPAVGICLPRVVPSEGFEYNGVFMPAGTIVGMNPWVVHRQKEVFGDDCESFRPERWLEGDRSQMDRHFFAFGIGARGCIGRNLAWIEITKFVPSLLMHFDTELVDPSKKPGDVCWMLVKLIGLNVKLTPRELVN